MKLNTNLWIAFGTEPYQPFNLAWCGNADGIGQANTLHTGLDHGIKNGQEIHEVAAKGILGREAHVASCRSNTANQGNGIRQYLLNATAMTKVLQLCRGAIKEVQPKDGCIQGGLYVRFNTAHMGNDPRPQIQFAQSLDSRARLPRDNGRRHFYEGHTQGIQLDGNLQPLLKAEKGSGKLLTFAQRRIEDGQWSIRTHNALSLCNT